MYFSPHDRAAVRATHHRAVTIPVTALMTALALVVTLLGAPRAAAFSITSPQGVDVASWQHPGGAAINWREVSASGHRFAFIKATEGIGYMNPYFVADSKQARNAGLLVGSYHMARPNSSASIQAAEYAAALATQPQPSLPPVLDIEYAENLGPAQLSAWVREFLTDIERLTGRRPIIYTYRYFWQENMANTSEFSDYPLWLAAYENRPPADIPGGWNHMSFWQRADNGVVPGMVTVSDMNLFNGSEQQLTDFSAGIDVNLGDVLSTGLDLDAIGGRIAELEALGNNNRELVGAILAVAAGALAVGALVAVAQSQGIDLGPATEIVDRVRELAARGDLPVPDLQTMLQTGEYTIGDLLILLRNAQHFAEQNS
ncbi:glycoside hydrolase family 25 protein [Corynebacterium sp. TAE3-ERU16]|uniref:glycoside hydrolase family 25 protein n=1 Tax=Corynebacterium sp. TAE3-ERU16 TaxID=2849493 RepID=UPI002107F469|nr:GH25 family lysozyme [Corynebacterium sp. TAE3-ERU16]